MSTESQRPDPSEDPDFFGEAPAGDATPDEYMSGDQQGGASEDTGVVYDQSGEPEETPQDESMREADEEE